MNEGAFAGLAFICLLAVLGGGIMLIDFYFKRKTQFVDDLCDRTKGNTDAESE